MDLNTFEPNVTARSALMPQLVDLQEIMFSDRYHLIAFMLARVSPTMMSLIAARKIIFYFSICSEKIIFPKKSHWTMIFLVSSGKMAFFFPKI